MMYVSTFLLAFCLFMLVVVWSLIEMRIEEQKERSLYLWTCRRSLKVFMS